MRKLTAILLVALLVLPDLAFAQAAQAQQKTVREFETYPFVTRIMTSAEEYASIIEKCDRKVLLVDCDLLPGVANRLWNLGIELGSAPVSDKSARQALAGWIRGLLVRPCPQSVKVTIARGVHHKQGGESIDTENWSRFLKEGEMCLVDQNNARVVISLTCGNFIVDNLPPVFTNQDEEGSTVTDPRRSRFDQRTIDQAARDAARDQEADSRSGGSQRSQNNSGWFGRNKGWLIPVGGAIGFALACGATHCLADVNVKTETNVNTTVR